jgi:hypothetical protein
VTARFIVRAGDRVLYTGDSRSAARTVARGAWHDPRNRGLTLCIRDENPVVGGISEFEVGSYGVEETKGLFHILCPTFAKVLK